jgi:WD40-like Beta Propeller Repeat
MPFPTRPSLVFTLSTLAMTSVSLSGLANASDALTKPNERLSVIDTAHLHALVPTVAVEKLKPIIARAEIIYASMAKDAKYEPRRLVLLVTDDLDTHNGFSTVTPFPIINVQLAPALQQSSIYTGYQEFERTLVHELAHHISNDVDPNGFRRTLSHIFGRILPNDPLSLAVAYLSTPAHQTMPSFWHEGSAQWAETEYATSPVWAGRGRDSLTHMVWRLDAAAGKIPDAGDWRLSYHEWPFGGRSYLYGIAYTRYLSAAYGDRANIWQLIERQQHRWAFAFNGGPELLLGKDHLSLIAEARQALATEQHQAMQILASKPITTAKRLTPINGTMAAPAWLPDGRLFAAYNDPYADPLFIRVDANGDTSSTWCCSAYSMSQARSLPDGTLIYSEADIKTDPWNRSLVNVILSNNAHVKLNNERLLQPDIKSLSLDAAPHVSGPTEFLITAIQLNEDGTQSLILTSFIHEGNSFWSHHQDGLINKLKTTGIPWSPTFRPGSHSLTWIETDRNGSRLLLADIEQKTPGQYSLSEPTVLAQIPGRILHPAWSADGAQLYFCADHSGVANAYRLDPNKPGQLVSVTNTVGGVLACVPSPDGKELAIIDHDLHGPFLARIANDPATWPDATPQLTLAWPAPVTPQANGKRGVAVAGAAPTKLTLPTDAGDAATVEAHPYHGLTEIRPLFWTPTTMAVPEGGLGVVGLMADPIFSHQMIGSAGIGLNSGSPVGLASYSYGGWPIDLGAVAWQSERAYDDQIAASGSLYDYVENVRSAEARIGHGLTGFRRRFQLYAAGGVAEYRPVHSASKKYDGLNASSSAPIFTDVERYAEVTLAYSDSTMFPTSYTLEDGTSFAVNYRHSGFGGELDLDRIIGRGSYVLSFWPRYGQQLVFGSAVGWSEGDHYLQNQFSVGGTFNLNQLPRGYTTTTALGEYLLGGSVAYRTPIWRPFWGHSTTPFVDRQTVLELFFDGAKASTDRLNGNGEWYRSVGANVYMNWMVWELMLNPGIGVAYQLDGKEDVKGLFSLDFLW